MLTEREQRTLREIERGLSADAPDLVATMRARRLRRPTQGVRLTYDAVAVIAALSAIACFVLGVVGAGLVAALFAAAVVQVRCLRFPPRADPGDQRPGRRRRGPGWRSGRGHSDGVAL
jgi:Protein of unknown function (DUF3040)